jgi:hypothetical protein
MFEAQFVRAGIEGHPIMKLAELKRLLTLDKCAALVAIIGFPLLLISLIFAVQLDKEVSLQIQKLTDIAQQQLAIAKSQNNIALNQMLYGDPTNIGIIDAIENKKPILKSATGISTSAISKRSKRPTRKDFYRLSSFAPHFPPTSVKRKEIGRWLTTSRRTHNTSTPSPGC